MPWIYFELKIPRKKNLFHPNPVFDKNNNCDWHFLLNPGPFNIGFLNTDV